MNKYITVQYSKYSIYFDTHSELVCFCRSIFSDPYIISIRYYFINCIKCNITYIGESKRTALIRLTEHLRKIKYFKNNKNKKDINVLLENSNDSVHLYKHFMSDDHNIEDHFRFQIFMSDIIEYRLRLETDLMYIFDTVYPNGLNKSTSKKNLFMHSYKNP